MAFEAVGREVERCLLPTNDVVDMTSNDRPFRFDDRVRIRVGAVCTVSALALGVGTLARAESRIRPTRGIRRSIGFFGKLIAVTDLNGIVMMEAMFAH